MAVQGDSKGPGHPFISETKWKMKDLCTPKSNKGPYLLD